MPTQPPEFHEGNIDPEDVGELLEAAQAHLIHMRCPCDTCSRLQRAVEIVGRHFQDPEPQEDGLDPKGEDKERRHGG